MNPSVPLSATVGVFMRLFRALPYASGSTVYAKLLDLGLMSVATDYPDVTLRELKTGYETRKAKQRK